MAGLRSRRRASQRCRTDRSAIMYFDYEGRGGTSNGNHVLAARAQFEGKGRVSTRRCLPITTIQQAETGIASIR